MNIKGKLIEKSETQEVSASFRKREFVVEFAENPQYPEYLKFELIQANCDQVNDVQVGEMISISFNLKGRKWTDPQGNVKYFNSLQAWRIEREHSGTTADPIPQEEQQWVGDSFSEDDDLPF
ncbi:MAG: DUF3127 domain-containing protein [Cyclobacteriaceae bacterium]|nr:DUF3127 domain-containing protein [Cyclobacteriaceae bacterium]